MLKMAQPFQDLYQDLQKEARAKGVEESKLEVAKKMLGKNMEIDIIAEITELSTETIRKLKEQLN